MALPQLVHAAARGTAPDSSALRSPAFGGDWLDVCYVKDCARAIASLQLAPRLNRRIYNIASGRVLTNGEVAATAKELVPDADRAARGLCPVWTTPPAGQPRHQPAPRWHRLPARLRHPARGRGLPRVPARRPRPLAL